MNFYQVCFLIFEEVTLFFGLKKKLYKFKVWFFLSFMFRNWNSKFKLSVVQHFVHNIRNQETWSLEIKTVFVTLFMMQSCQEQFVVKVLRLAIDSSLVFKKLISNICTLLTKNWIIYIEYRDFCRHFFMSVYRPKYSI